MEDELYTIVDAVSILFNEKKQELKEAKLLTEAKEKECKSLSKKVAALNDYIKEIKEIKHLNSSNSSLLINFRKRASDISEEIMNL